MLDLYLQIGGRLVTTEETTNLPEQFSLNAHVQHLVGIHEGQRLPEDEDINTLECLEVGLEQSKEEAKEDVEQGNDDEDWAPADRAFYDKAIVTTQNPALSIVMSPSL